MIHEHDIKAKSILISNTAINLGLGAVPKGMKRWVTFIRINTYNGTVPYIMLGSGTTATDITLANQKFRWEENINQLYLNNTPKVPDPDRPLFSIAGEHYLTAYGLGIDVIHRLFIQYYDE